MIKRIINYIMRKCFPELYQFSCSLRSQKSINEQWRLLNPHNETQLRYSVYAPLENTTIQVGIGSYGILDVYSYRSLNEGLLVGNYVSIGKNTKFILGGEHYSNTYSTYPFKKKNMQIAEEESFSKGPIVIEDDVWIGQDCIILSGVKLARGTIVGAGSVVAKSTKPYSIVAGNPAKLIRYRFDEGMVQSLIETDMSKLSQEFIGENIDRFYSRSIDDVKYIIQHLNEKY